MDQFPDWVEMVNVNLSDHEARLQMLETAVKTVDLDDGEYTWPPGVVEQNDKRIRAALKDAAISPGYSQYDLRTSSERQAARLDNHDQRLRAIEHRLLLIEVELRELVAAVKADR